MEQVPEKLIDLGPRLALQFIENIAHLNETEEVLDLLLEHLAPYKIKALLFSEIPEPGETLHDCALGIRWPKEYLDFYMENRFEHDDPLFLQAKRSIFPFYWNMDRTDTETSIRGQRIMKMAHEQGLRSGLCIPIHGPDGYAGCARFAFSEESTRSIYEPRLYMMALYTYKRLLEIQHAEIVEKPLLTQREHQVLKLVAAGLPAHEIAEQLSISKRTVDEHVKQAIHKLGALNRANAVAIAVRDGHIELNPRN